MNKIFLDRIFFVLHLAMIAIAATSVAKAAGEVDTSFTASAYANDSTQIRTTVIQPDGKVLIAGSFTIANGVSRDGIVRLNTDGSVDTQFNPPAFFESTNNLPGGKINTIGLQSNGKILVAGQLRISNSTYKNIVRLNTDGSLDNTFADLSAQFDNAEYIDDLVINPDDTIYINGPFSVNILPGGLNSNQIAKLNADGSIDSGSVFSFTEFYDEIAVQPNGKIIAANAKLVRFEANGIRDNSFPEVVSNGRTNKVVVQADGKILIVGTFNIINGFSQGRISRINTDGSIDTTFNPNGVGASSLIRDISIGTDGKIFITGGFSTFNGVAKINLAKLNSDGTLDNSFTLDSAVSPSFTSSDVQQDGKIIVSTSFTNNTYRLNSDGTL